VLFVPLCCGESGIIYGGESKYKNNKKTIENNKIVTGAKG